MVPGFRNLQMKLEGFVSFLKSSIQRSSCTTDMIHSDGTACGHRDNIPGPQIQAFICQLCKCPNVYLPSLFHMCVCIYVYVYVYVCMYMHM